jgi:uncharacterized protein (TIGR00297 family)
LGDDLTRWLWAAATATAVASLAVRLRALSPSGGVASVLVGAVVAGGAGWWAGVLLVLFFVSSSALSRLRSSPRPVDLGARSHRRDAVQVLANGGPAAAAALAAAVAPAAATPVLVAACAGAVAAAAADTWATEIGAFSPTPPRLLLGGVPVPPGTSGGMTPTGTAAAVAGALTIALAHALGAAAGWTPGAWSSALSGTLLAGVAGALTDSLLGGTLQAAYRCPVCDEPTERTRHRCGAQARLVRGYPAVTNDAVNAAATAAGAVVGAAVAALAT